MTTTWVEETVQMKGDLPGHPFRGNQWSGGQGGGLRRDLVEARGYTSESDVDADFDIVNDEYQNILERVPAASSVKINKLILSNTEYYAAPGTQVDSFGYADEERGIIGLATGGKAMQNESVPLLDVSLVDSSGRGAFRHELGHMVYSKLNDISENARYEWEDRAPSWIDEGLGHAVSSYGSSRETELFAEAFTAYSHKDYGSDERLPKEIEEFFDRTLGKQQKSPSRLAILHKALEIVTAAVRLKQLLLKDQLRNAVVKAVHLKQYAETEAELTDAMEGLIKKQFADAGRKLGRTKDEVELIEKGDLPGHPFRGNQWEGGQGGAATPVDKIEAHLRLAQEARETRSPKRRQELRDQARRLFDEVQEETGITDTQSPEWRALFDQARQQMGTPKTEPKQEVKPDQKPELKPLSPVKLDAKADATVAEYQALSYEINGYLREGPLKDAPSNIQQQVRKLDRVIADNGTTLEREEVLYRGLDMEDLPGNEFKDGGFGSSSTNQVSAAFFGDAVLRVRVQPGVRVLPVLSGQESEVILERGLNYKVGERVGEVERKGRVVPVYDVEVSKRHSKSSSLLATKSFQIDSIFDPRDWDSDLVNTALPILMKKAGEAAAAQMLLMGLDIAPKGKRTKGDLPGHPFRGNQWSSGRESYSTVREFRSAHETWIKDNLPDIGIAIDRWSDNTTWAKQIVDASAGKSAPPESVKAAEVFERAFITAPKIEQTIYRGMHGLDDETFSRYATKGSEITLDRLQSFSADEKVATRFSGKVAGNRVLLKVVTDEGVYIGGSWGEQEVLMPRGTKIRVVKSRTKKDGTLQVDVAVVKDEQKSYSPFQTKASRATEWLLDLDDADIDTMTFWPEVFTLPSGLTVDLGFATEWPDWMKAEISQQMKECFEQPFWAGINDTTAKGIESHLLRGLEEGWSIAEIRAEMVGDGLNEYYRNRGLNIARTESGNVLNGARSAAMERLSEEVPGLKTKKTWMSVLGTTTRDTHAHLDGVPADRDGMWYLGGVRIPWPGHWNLPAGERCNCQCTLVQSWGMGDDAASELIEEYNQRLAAERSLKRLWEKTEKGDLPGHPFRGNQWGRGGETVEGKSIFKNWIESPESNVVMYGSGVISSSFTVDGREFNSLSTPGADVHVRMIVKNPKYNTRALKYQFTDESGSYEVTGRGSAMKVMRRAVQELGNHLRMKNVDPPYYPEVVFFSAKEPSRQKLYEFMTTRVGELFPGYVGVKVNGTNTYAIVKEGIELSDRVSKLEKTKSVDFLDHKFWNELMKSLRDFRREKFVKGDLPGHPFRGNQWSGGQGRGEVRTFPTEAAARDWLEANMKVDLTADEQRAREDYITSGHWNINKLARGKEINENDVSRVQKTIDNLDSVIRKSVIPENVVAYRGIRTSLVKELFGEEGPKVGDVIEDKGFASAGIIPSPRSQWIIRMNLPAGSHAMYGSNPEAELVLARGSKFRVTKITEGTLEAPQAPRHQAPLGDMKIIDVEVSW